VVVSISKTIYYIVIFFLFIISIGLMGGYSGIRERPLNAAIIAGCTVIIYIVLRKHIFTDYQYY
jgi:hypothetical protein